MTVKAHHMKRYKKIIFVSLLCISFSIINTQQASAQMIIIEAIKAAAKKVIRAIDLQVQRIQNKTIDLQNVQKKIENALSKLKLEEIASWTEKQKEIYRGYFEELWKVKAIISYYRQFTDIVSKQKQLFEEYKRAYVLVGEDKHFSDDEVEYMYVVYSNILEASIASVNDVLNIMQSFNVQMSDADRLEIINKTSNELDDQLSALRQFNQRNQLLSLQRAKSQSEIETIKKLYGFEQ